MNRFSITMNTTLRLLLATGLALTAVACASDAPTNDDFVTVELSLDEGPATVAPTVAGMCVPISMGSPDICKPYKFWVKS